MRQRNTVGRRTILSGRRSPSALLIWVEIAA